ncbi:MAG: rRNA pseudouridine synthase [Clostridiales bacterium]|jgi:23S rRNA pseudouridine2605 synthase|nr:rRNA pseudouridine synthase [Clostridiales bacterium]
MRINKYLADCGAASRRACDKLIEEGKVKVNGKPAVIGQEINTDNDTVTLDGIKLVLSKKNLYLMFNKPKGCICTRNDEKGRKTIYDYVDLKERLVSVGRLDYDSEGLLILTTDGALVNYLTHPSNEIPKTYHVKIDGEVLQSDLATLRAGVEIDGVKTSRAKIKLIEFSDNISRFEMTIYEGRNRQIKKMFETIGKEVLFLKRVSIGDLKLGGLSRGAHRELTPLEVNYLKKL